MFAAPFSTRKLHGPLHTHRTHDEEQVVLNGKSPLAGILQAL